MKYVPIREFEVVTEALNFDTADCHVRGGCDLYTTKAAGPDKKLYKDIENTLQAQYQSQIRLCSSLPPSSPPAQCLDLSRSSPFGSLTKISSRRTFAYLIATLNASHPDYDYSDQLRTSDFHREGNLKTVMNTVNTTLSNLRPRPSFLNLPTEWADKPQGPPTPGSTVVWGPRMWRIIDSEMTLRECDMYCYAPDEDPFDEEEGSIWSYNYFFFNKSRKRVCYLYLRGSSIMSRSPGTAEISVPATPKPVKRIASAEKFDLPDYGASKRARYWLGDDAEVALKGMSSNGNDEEEDDYMMGTYSEAGSPESSGSRRKSVARNTSEDFADSMEI